MTEPTKLPPNPISPMLALVIDKACGIGTVDTLWLVLQTYARAAIEADRQARGELRCMGTNCTAPGDDHSPECILEAAESQGWAESPEADAARLDIQQREKPKYFTYVINGCHRGISETEPPEDSYDGGTLQALYTAPQPQQQAGEPAIYSPPGELPPADDENGRYYETTLRDAVNEAYSSGFSDGRSRNNAPQPQQIPEGYRLVPENLSTQVCAKVFSKIISYYREEGQYPHVRLVHKWVLEAAPEPKGEV